MVALTVGLHNCIDAEAMSGITPDFTKCQQDLALVPLRHSSYFVARRGQHSPFTFTFEALFCRIVFLRPV